MKREPNPSDALQSRVEFRGRKLIERTTALVAVAALTLAACSGSDKDNSARKHAKKAGVEATVEKKGLTPKDVEASQHNMKLVAKDAALTMLNLMDQPGSGTEAYDGYYVGNKAANVGPDLVYGTADDAAYRNWPEMRAVYDPMHGQIRMLAIGSTPADMKAAETFSGIDLTFRVAKDNPIVGWDHQLEVEDFRRALSDPSSFELISVGTQVDWNYDDVAKKATGYAQAMNYEPGFRVTADKMGFASGTGIHEVTSRNQLEKFEAITSNLLDTAANELVARSMARS